MRGCAVWDGKKKPVVAGEVICENFRAVKSSRRAVGQFVVLFGQRKRNLAAGTTGGPRYATHEVKTTDVLSLDTSMW